MRDIMRKKGIDRLYHFTQAQNLESIFRYGIMPRDVLESQKIVSYYNDEYRFDNCMDAVCTSIEFPNYKMFYKLRQDNPKTDWAVLRLDAYVMCDFECAYCWTNAGDATMYNEPLDNRMGVEAFLELFGNRCGYPRRETLNIADWYPTNPQAEVLVFGIIPPDYIQDVYFKNHIELQRYCDFIPNREMGSVNYDVFAPRNDWKAWQNQGE